MSLILLIWSSLNEIRSYKGIPHEKKKPKQNKVGLLGLQHVCLLSLLRDLQSRFSSDRTVIGSSASPSPHQHAADPTEEATERITYYLMSMRPPEATAKDRTPQSGQTAAQQGAQPAENPARRSPRLDLEAGVHKDLPFGPMSTCTMSQCDVESTWSDWSLKSGSTLNTRDEAAYRDGLSALDTSIANLLKSIQLDHNRMCS